MDTPGERVVVVEREDEEPWVDGKRSGSCCLEGMTGKCSKVAESTVERCQIERAEVDLYRM